MRLEKSSAVALAALTVLAGATMTVDKAVAADAKPFRMIVGEPRFMDPNLATDYSIYVNAQLFEPLARIDNKGNLTLLEAKSIEVGAGQADLDHHARPQLQMVERPADHRRRLGIFLEAPSRSRSSRSEVAAFLVDVENAEDYNKGKITDVNQVAIKATGRVHAAGGDGEGRAAIPRHPGAALSDADPEGGGREGRREVDRAGEHPVERPLQAGQPQERPVDRDGGEPVLRRQEAGDPAHRDDDRLGRSLHRAAPRLRGGRGRLRDLRALAGHRARAQGCDARQAAQPVPRLGDGLVPVRPLARAVERQAGARRLRAHDRPQGDRRGGERRHGARRPTSSCRNRSRAATRRTR